MKKTREVVNALINHNLVFRNILIKSLEHSILCKSSDFTNAEKAYSEIALDSLRD